MIKKAIWIGLTLSLFGLVSAPGATADEWNKKTVLTFSQPVEIPGHVLPAGTYTFQLADVLGDRHIVQVFNADGSRILATVMTIPDYRLEVTDKTVITFGEVPRGSPEVIRAWFYPGHSTGQEFVYPKSRATTLAKAANAIVPAIAVDVVDVGAMKTAPIVAITPDEKTMPVAAAIQTTPGDTAGTIEKVATVQNSAPAAVGTTGVTWAARHAENARELPKTAGNQSLIMLLGFGSIGLALGLMIFGKRAAASVV